ncbi:MAG: aldo/keto reductase [Candidatus Coatesbacteria bacterium]
MQYTEVGRTGIRVSRLCFGTMSFGGDADEAMSAKLFKRCRDAGITFFDCANVYSHGRAEEILGKLMKGSRDELVITTKVFGKMGDGPEDSGLSRPAIVKAIDDSLRRLGTDHVDFYFCHMFDPAVPMEETLRAIDDLVREGKVRHPAISNWAAWRIEKALGVCALRKYARVALLQPMYSLVKRQAETEILPMALDEGLGVIPYSPLAGGLLSGKYAGGTKPAAGRFNTNAMYEKRYGEAWVHDTAARFAEHARGAGHHPVALANAWVMSHPAVTAPIIGARNLDQLEPALGAVDIPMTETLRREISALSREPAVATDRTEERTN